MVVYSVTVKVEIDLHDEWLDWMKTDHIPQVMETKKFQDYKIHRVLNQDERDGITYNFHYRALTMADYFDYKADYWEKLQQEFPVHFKEKTVSFRTVLKEVE